VNKEEIEVTKSVETKKQAGTPGGYREVLHVAYPLIISMGSFTIMQFFDRMFLAWYSATAIQAALPAGILSFTMVCGFMALAGYANSFVAQYHGSGDRRGCSRSTAQGIFVAAASWPFMLALIPLGLLILNHAGHAPDVVIAERSYFIILMLGSITPPLGAAVGGFFTGRGDTLTNMYAFVAGNIVNIIFDYALIFGHWGFPEMGIRGAAWATVGSGFVAPGILFGLYFRKKVRAEYDTIGTFKFDWPLMRRMLRFGFPSAFHLFLDVSSFSFFVLLVGRLGRVELTASNIALAVNSLAFMPLLGIGMAATIMVGQYQGRHDHATAERSGWTALKIGWFYMSVIAITFLAFPRQYFSLFTSRGTDAVALSEVLPLGRVLLMMMAVWGLLDTVNLVLSGGLKGAGDTRFVMIYSVIMAWCVWIVGEVLIVLVFKAGLIVAWMWLAFYVFLLAVGFFWRFRSGRWKTIELLEPSVPFTTARSGVEALTVGD